jgi:hypothetical protein
MDLKSGYSAGKGREGGENGMANEFEIIQLPAGNAFPSTE